MINSHILPFVAGFPRPHPVGVQVGAEEAPSEERGGHGAEGVEEKEGQRGEQCAGQGQHHGAHDILKDSVHVMIAAKIDEINKIFQNVE